ncbi:AraC family transcriptional regulator [Halioxenophilus aromaticivorans]|uniref:HTH araC/xylS-type domain-containing protein n=1 Tax=Halioxenophilus aromaticivorans TaxID=1306992 RepID=A0AAV3U3W6_9ALTE
MADYHYLRSALLFDETGAATSNHELVKSSDFDEIRLWSDKVYMPYTVDPIGKNIRPNSSLHALEIGSMKISRFRYGIPVHLHDFSSDTGVGMVLTTLQGYARHWQNASNYTETARGESFIVDNSRVEYTGDFNPDHLQLNVTFSHAYIEELFRKITGQCAPEDLWQARVKFGPGNTSWASLLEYAIRMMTAPHNALIKSHLEESLGTNLIMQWAAASGFDLNNSAGIAPSYVVKAERYLQHNAQRAPTMSELAASAGVSGRALHNAFKKYRNTTPMKYLRELRLQGVKSELQQAPGHVTVAEIAYGWGFSCLGRFASVYKCRFGELPSSTRRRAD